MKEFIAQEKTGHYRYRILALVFMATTINYFDRSILGVLARLTLEGVLPPAPMRAALLEDLGHEVVEATPNAEDGWSLHSGGFDNSGIAGLAPFFRSRAAPRGRGS